MINPLWSYALTAIGVTGLFFVSSSKWWGFAVGLGVQMLWIVYAFATDQPGFYVSALAYGAVNVRGWRKFRRAQKEREMPRPGPRRPLLSARVDAEDKAWVESRVADEDSDYPDFIRRMVSFARTHMPMNWGRPEPAETPSDPTQDVEATTSDPEEK